MVQLCCRWFSSGKRTRNSEGKIRQTHAFVTKNTSFVVTKVCLPRPNLSCNKIMCATKRLSWQMFVVTSIFLLWQKTCFVTTNMFVAINTCLLRQKRYLWQLPPMIFHVCFIYMNANSHNSPVQFVPWSLPRTSAVCCPHAAFACSSRHACHVLCAPAAEPANGAVTTERGANSLYIQGHHYRNLFYTISPGVSN